MNHTGSLTVVATPIGHLSDMSNRAIECLKRVDAIAAEDTRHSRKLLNFYNITTSLFSLHEHNEVSQIEHILKRLQRGEHLALISDAGTPLISDPGYRLIAAVHEAGFPVSPIPGPCALVAALSCSGLPSDRFLFEGFLPAKPKARLQRLASLDTVSPTLCFYESPHRIMNMLNDCMTVFGTEREAVLAKELTKIHEAIVPGCLKGLVNWLAADERRQQGEFVVLIAGQPEAEKPPGLSDETMRTLTILLADMPLKQAVGLCTEITGEPKNRIYEAAVELKGS